MKNTIIKITALVFLFCFIAGPVMAADVLDIGSGARSIALGRTYTTARSDAYGIFGNPAGLRGITMGQIVSMYGQMNDTVNYSLLGYVMPTEVGKIFAGYAANETPDFISTTLSATTGRPVAGSTFDFRNDVLILGYENTLNKAVSYGLRMKFYRKGSTALSLVSGSGANADAGLMITPNDTLTLGLTAKNILLGQAIVLHNGQMEQLPAGIDIGLGLAANKKLDLFADLSLTGNIPAEAKVGLELRLNDRLALRFGMEQKMSGGNSSYINGSAGVGFNIGAMAIDYAYSYDTLLDTNSRHFVSFSLKTPGFRAPE